MSENIIMRAVELAREVQEQTNATRKYSGRPYLTHPLRVMGRVAAHPGASELEVAAGVLHDVHEDPPYVPLERIERQIHPVVAKYVELLTNPSKKLMLPDGTYPKEWNRAKRKQLDQDHLAGSDYWTQTIKGYDREDNVEELLHDLMLAFPKQPPLDFIRLYCDESDVLAVKLDKIEKWQKEGLVRSISLLRSFAATKH